MQFIVCPRFPHIYKQFVAAETPQCLQLKTRNPNEIKWIYPPRVLLNLFQRSFNVVALLFAQIPAIPGQTMELWWWRNFCRFHLDFSPFSRLDFVKLLWTLGKSIGFSIYRCFEVNGGCWEIMAPWMATYSYKWSFCVWIHSDIFSM